MSFLLTKDIFRQEATSTPNVRVKDAHNHAQPVLALAECLRSCASIELLLLCCAPVRMKAVEDDLGTMHSRHVISETPVLAAHKALNIHNGVCIRERIGVQVWEIPSTQYADLDSSLELIRRRLEMFAHRRMLQIEDGRGNALF